MAAMRPPRGKTLILAGDGDQAQRALRVSEFEFPRMTVADVYCSRPKPMLLISKRTYAMPCASMSRRGEPALRHRDLLKRGKFFSL
jgi:hypothetical protein